MVSNHLVLRPLTGEQVTAARTHIPYINALRGREVDTHIAHETSAMLAAIQEGRLYHLPVTVNGDRVDCDQTAVFLGPGVFKSDTFSESLSKSFQRVSAGHLVFDRRSVALQPRSFSVSPFRATVSFSPILAELAALQVYLSDSVEPHEYEYARVGDIGRLKAMPYDMGLSVSEIKDTTAIPLFYHGSRPGEAGRQIYVRDTDRGRLGVLGGHDFVPVVFYPV